MKASLGYLFIFLIFCYESSSQNHNPGADCLNCHQNLKIGGTIFSNQDGTSIQPDIQVKLIAENGEISTLLYSDTNGNISTPTIADGLYLIEMGNASSKTWHNIPEQASCNKCHVMGGNGNEVRIKQMSEYHTRLITDVANNCKDCHHYPASMAYEQLKTSGVLVGNKPELSTDEDWVRINGVIYDVDMDDFDGIETVRPDIFAPGYFSAFDVILATAAKNEIDIQYEWDEEAKTHWIISVNGVGGDYWYKWNSDNNDAKDNEIDNYNRQNRWDEFLYRTGTKVSLESSGQDLAELKTRYRQEIASIKEKDGKSVVNIVEIIANPSDYHGNTDGSNRVDLNYTFTDVVVTPHNLRAACEGADSVYKRPFQPGVLTTIDILLSMADSGLIDNVKTQYFDRIHKSLTTGHWVQSITIDGKEAHASGSNGFVFRSHLLADEDLSLYTGFNSGNLNTAAGSMHFPQDLYVMHEHDYAFIRWMEIGPGTPYYEADDPWTVQTIIEDYESIDRGFNLRSIYPNPFNEKVNISFNIFEPQHVSVSVYNITGQKVATLFNEQAYDIGEHRLIWQPENLSYGTYYVVMKYGNNSTQTRKAIYAK